MADVINTGTFAESGDGDGIREGGVKANAKWAADDILITQNISDISDNADAIALLGNKAISSIPTQQNTTADTFANIGTVSLVTLSATSQLKLSFSGICTLRPDQKGAEFQLSYSIDNGSNYNTIVITAFQVDAVTIAAEVNISTLSNSIIIDSPSPVNTVIVNLNWRAIIAGETVSLEGVSNILEIEEF